MQKQHFCITNMFLLPTPGCHITCKSNTFASHTCFYVVSVHVAVCSPDRLNAINTNMGIVFCFMLHTHRSSGKTGHNFTSYNVALLIWQNYTLEYRPHFQSWKLKFRYLISCSLKIKPPRLKGSAFHLLPH